MFADNKNKKHYLDQLKKKRVGNNGEIIRKSYISINKDGYENMDDYFESLKLSKKEKLKTITNNSESYASLAPSNNNSNNDKENKYPEMPIINNDIIKKNKKIKGISNITNVYNNFASNTVNNFNTPKNKNRKSLLIRDVSNYE